MNAKECHILEHTTGWQSSNPLYRNHFCTEPGCDDWDTIQELCKRGLMRLAREPSELTGGGHVFAVTKDGIAALQKLDPKRIPERNGSAR